MMMGTFSLWHWIVVVLILVIIIWLPVRILHKAGYSGWWVLLTLIPVVNIVVLWTFAFADWPRLARPD
jgi:uncharacterized membrane protein YhaH (DUF805 family)